MRRRIDWPLMGKARGAKTPEFGRLLLKYRERLGKRHALTEVVTRLRDLGIETGPTTIHNYEKGRPPDAGLLWGLSRVYGEDFLKLCGILAKELGGTLDEAPTVPPKPLSREEAMLVRFYRAAEGHPNSQAAMLVACGALAGAQTSEADAADLPTRHAP